MKNPKNTKKRIIIHALPHELIDEILLRLPVKSLLRFKCVCKSWLSLISDPQFAKSHFDLSAAPSYRLLRRRSCTSLCSIDIDGSLNTASVYRHPSPPCPPKCFVDNVEILGSCRGFVLLYYERGYLCLWNPATASRKQLPGSFSDLTRFYHYGFGYDASTDDYLIFLVRLQKYVGEYKRTSEIQFFSVKTNSWKFMNGVDLPYKDMGCRVGSPFNGALHWLVFSSDKKFPVIIAFDLMERTLSDIPLPHDSTVGSEYDLHGLRVMDGCLSVLCTVQNSAGNETWLMKEYKVQSSWTISYRFSPRRFLPAQFYPSYITKDGGILGTGIRGNLEKRNNKGELLEHLAYGLPLGLCTNNLQPSIYRESLLSLPSVNGANK